MRFRMIASQVPSAGRHQLSSALRLVGGRLLEPLS
jgi:hypothetical protein